MRFEKNILFRKITIKYKKTIYTFELPYLLKQSIITLNNIDCEVKSIIEDEVILLINNKEVILNIKKNKYISKQEDLKIKVVYVKKNTNLQNLTIMKYDELNDAYDSTDDVNEKEQIAFLIYNWNNAEGLALVTLACVSEDKERAIQYAHAAARLGYYRGYYYIGREYFHEDNVNQALNWLLMFEDEEMQKSLSNKIMMHYYDMLASCFLSSENYMKASYYAYQGTKNNSGLSWYILYLIHSYKKYLPHCLPYMKYCLEQVSNVDIDITKELNELKDIKSIKPNYSYLDNLKDKILENINSFDIYIEGIKCRQPNSVDVEKAEQCLTLACELYHSQAFSSYILALNSCEIHDEPHFSEDGYLEYFKTDIDKAFKLLQIGCSIGDADSMLILFAFAADEILYDKISLDEVKKYYDLFLQLHNDKLTDLKNGKENKEILELYEESIKEKTNTETHDQTYLNNYYLYNKILKLKKEFLINKDIKQVNDDFIPIKQVQDMSTTDIELHASYYLTIQYNEKLAYYYASLGYALGSKYCTYLMGAIYELGIFVPNILSYSKFFYKKINDANLKTMNYVKEVEPQILKLPITNDFFEFDPVVSLINGLKLISTDCKGMPSTADMIDGLKLIKDAADAGYSEAKYILGCLYYDVDQGNSRLWTKGKLIHLESNPYLASNYFNEAIVQGHEKSLLIMAALHSNKGNSENKVQGKYDNDWCLHYWSILYELYQYSFIKDIGLTKDSEKMLFDFYGIRFAKDIYEYLGERYGRIITTLVKEKTMNLIEIGNSIVAMFSAQLNNYELFYSQTKTDIYLVILKNTIINYMEKKKYTEAYDIIRIIYKLGLNNENIDEISEKIKANKFEIAYLKLLTIE